MRSNTVIAGPGVVDQRYAHGAFALGHVNACRQEPTMHILIANDDGDYSLVSNIRSRDHSAPADRAEEIRSTALGAGCAVKVLA
jgi:hypothetical protein